MTRARRAIQGLAAVAVSLALAASGSLAQETMDSRWLPWLGCWQAGPESLLPEGLLVCVHPLDGADGVEIATVADGQIASVRTLVADGQPHDVMGETCSGWQSAIFSADGLRVFARSELTCENGVRRSASAIMAMGPSGEWLDAQSVGIDQERVPRVLRYAPAPSATWPAGFELSVDRATEVAEARALASARVSTADVEEAAARVEPEALVAFLIERGQRFPLDGSRLAELAAAGVPEDVIDVLVAVSYPDRFAIDRQSMDASLQQEPRRGSPYLDRVGYDDAFGWGRTGFGGCYAPAWDSYHYGSVYCSPYDYGYGAYPFGYRRYYPSRGGYVRPIIVVLDDNAQARPPGRVVRGRGYTRGGQPPGSDGVRYARPRGSRGYGTPSGSVRSGGSPSRSGSVSRGGYSRGGSASSSGGKAKTREKSNRRRE